MANIIIEYKGLRDQSLGLHEDKQLILKKGINKFNMDEFHSFKDNKWFLKLKENGLIEVDVDGTKEKPKKKISKKEEKEWNDDIKKDAVSVEIEKK